MSFRHFLNLKVALKAKFWPRHHTGSSALYGDVVIFPMRRLSHGKKMSDIKNSHSFVWGIHEFLAFTIFLGLKFNSLSSKKVSDDRHGSVEVRETLFKALRTSVGAE